MPRILLAEVHGPTGAPGSPGARLQGVALVLSREPAARGEVKTGVVARLVHQLWRSLSEGALVLEEGGRERRLFFLRGVAVASETARPGESLVRWMADAGRLDASGLRAVRDAMDGGLSAGAALIAAGALEPGEPLQAALRAHLQATLAAAIGANRGRWRFHAGAEIAAELQPVEILPLHPILEGARAAVPREHFADALRAVLEAFPVRTRDFQRIVPAAGLGAADLRLATSLDGRTTARAWLAARGADPGDALSLLWFLSMVGAVVFHESAEPEDDAGGGARPSPRPPLPADRAEALRQGALQILPGTYLHALGLDLATDAVEVERAYADVASRFHPDAFAAYDVGELADLLAAVQDKLSAARAVLADDAKRRAYLSFLLLRFELTGARTPPIDLDAEIALKRGERALRARRTADAVAAFRDAAARNPREPEYAAAVGFARLVDGSLGPADRAAAAKRCAASALALTPRHARASAVLALAEERLGDRAEARRVLREALEAHPDRELLSRVLQRIERPEASPPRGPG